MLKPGDCLLIETNRDGFGEIQSHLYVIILEPQGQTRSTIIVNITTLNSKKQDQTIILEPGDHDFIVNHSYVHYGRAEIVPIDHLEVLVGSGEAKQYPPLKEELFQRVCSGILKSPHTPFGVQDLYHDYLYSKM